MKRIIACLMVTCCVSVQPTFAQLRDLTADPKAAAITKLATDLDAILEASWKEQEVTPAPLADDGEFLRRAMLDLIGRTPRVSEAREFLADTDPDKRAKIVVKLLQMPGYAVHTAAVIRGDWFGYNSSDFQKFFAASRVQTWLQTELQANTPQDDMVRRLLTTKVNVGQRGRVNFDDAKMTVDEISIRDYYRANDGKPETVAATVTRTFLGLKLECAQCHDHPFAPYTKEQFWQFAAFFGEFTALSPISPSFVGPHLPQTDVNQIDIPNTGRSVVARFLDDTQPEWTAKTTPREELADWLLAPRNPYFAKNMANRIWAQFIGVGIIDPIDEPGEENQPSHPELLDRLAKGVRELGYDRQALTRAIMLTRAYQLSSKQTHPSQANPRHIARANMRGLTGDQVFDSFVAATGQRPTRSNNNDFFNNNRSQGRQMFTTMFGTVLTKPTESRTSILQSLMMMNSNEIAQQTNISTGTTIAAIADAPFLTTEQKLETLFLAAFTRMPTPGERQKYLSHLDRAGKKTTDQGNALADIFWVLLNSPEFVINH